MNKRFKIFLFAAIGGFFTAANFPFYLISIPFLIYTGIYIERGNRKWKETKKNEIKNREGSYKTNKEYF